MYHPQKSRLVVSIIFSMHRVGKWEKFFIEVQPQSQAFEDNSRGMRVELHVENGRECTCRPLRTAYCHSMKVLFSRAPRFSNKETTSVRF